MTHSSQYSRPGVAQNILLDIEEMEINLGALGKQQSLWAERAVSAVRVNVRGDFSLEF